MRLETAICQVLAKSNKQAVQLPLEEAYYTPKSAEAKKAFAIVTGMDDVADLVEFMKGLSSYYVDYAKENDNAESKDLAKHLMAAYNVVKD